MVSRHDDIVAALKHARDLIIGRGYQPLYGSVAEGGPLNISNALTRACGDYELYLLCRQSFSQNWGGPVVGLVHWETEKRHTVSDVITLFGKVLKGLETNETRPTGSALPDVGVVGL